MGKASSPKMNLKVGLEEDLCKDAKFRFLKWELQVSFCVWYAAAARSRE